MNTWRTPGGATRGGAADDFEAPGPVSAHTSRHEARHRYAARLVGASDADDVVQESLVRAWRRWSTYDERRGAPLPWLLAIVRDRGSRHRSRRRVHVELAAADGVAVGRDPDVDLERAIGQLPPRQREAVDLYYFVDLDVAAIAEVMTLRSGHGARHAPPGPRRAPRADRRRR